MIEDFTIKVDLAPQFICGESIPWDKPSVKVGSAHVPKGHAQRVICVFSSTPRLEDVQITADSSLQLLQPLLTKATYVSNDTWDSHIFIFEITFPNASTVPVDKVAREFAIPVDAPKNYVSWVGQPFPVVEKVNPDHVDPLPTTSTSNNDRHNATSQREKVDDDPEGNQATNTSSQGDRYRREFKTGICKSIHAKNGC